MNILFLGDVVAKAGRQAVTRFLPDIIKKDKVDLTIANVENLAGGKGATEDTLEELEAIGIDVFTSGNHIWFRDEIYESLDTRNNLLRPANYPEDTPGQGYTIKKVGTKKALVINLMGRVFIPGPIEDPFRAIDKILIETKKDKPNFIIVDIHAEATSEKAALGWYLDGRATLVAGTHTHVPTCDERILPTGTAFVSDVGMSGAIDSVLGVDKDIVIATQKYPYPQRFEWIETGPKAFRSVLVKADDKTGKALGIERRDHQFP